MSIFAIVPLGGQNAAALPEAIGNAFPEVNRMLLDGGVWLVAGQGTAQDVSTRIGINEGHVGSAIVIEAASYFGRANPAIWSWIKNNWEASALG